MVSHQGLQLAGHHPLLEHSLAQPQGHHSRIHPVLGLPRGLPTAVARIPDRIETGRSSRVHQAQEPVEGGQHA